MFFPVNSRDNRIHVFGTIVMMSIIAVVAVSTSNLTAAAEEPMIPTSNVIHIGAIPGETLYNVSAIKLEKNTTYTIFFHNPDPTPHNLVIATDGRNIRNALDAVELENDIVLGPSFNDDNPEAPGTWSMNWTTPSKDTYIPFFCSFIGHFEKGMRGYFQIGNPDQDPPAFAVKTPYLTLEEIIPIVILFTLGVLLKKGLDEDSPPKQIQKNS